MCLVVIATHNRAAELARTLASLAQCRFDGCWEILVVDNNSVDFTRAVVEAANQGSSAQVTYMFEGEPGRSAALNAGIRRARGGKIIATTDDDVRVDQLWLSAALTGFRRHNCDYVTGRVLPVWPAEPPGWFPTHGGGVVWGVLALLDFGPDAVPLVGRAPIGVNAAFRRDAFERVGLFNNRVGRKPGTFSVRKSVSGTSGREAGPARFLPARDECQPCHSRRAPHETLLPPVVLLARRAPGDPVQRAKSAQHGVAGAHNPRVRTDPSRSRHAAIPVRVLSSGVRSVVHLPCGSRRSRGVPARVESVALPGNRSTAVEGSSPPRGQTFLCVRQASDREHHEPSRRPR